MSSLDSEQQTSELVVKVIHDMVGCIVIVFALASNA